MDKVAVGPCLVIMAGLPGTGKSTLSHNLAAELHGALLDKDMVRGALFGRHWVEYSRAQDDFCLELMLQTAGYFAGIPKPPGYIFIDGRTFAFSYQIERVVSYADEIGSKVKIIHLCCSDEIARKRLSKAHVAKNRNFEMYLEIKKIFEPIERPKLTLNTDNGLTAVLFRQSVQYLQGD
jgi:predicted kinase